MAESIGQQVGNYRLVRLLGHGGFADVYLGEHVYLHTAAAIKILHTQLAQEDIETFRNEALTIAHLVHPHIVRVLDFDVEEARPFLVMDYAPHGNLRLRYPKGSRLPSASVVSYVKQVASALQYAHDRKLIHRDVKPENMLLGHNQEVLLSDFGIALVAQSSHSQQTEQEVVGTMAYMAPEQIQGKARPASDQYALAAVTYEWLCGTRPFTGSYYEIVAQHLSTSPAPLHTFVQDIPFAVEQVVLRALAKDPHQRFPRVQDFADALELAYQAPAPSVHPVPPQVRLASEGAVGPLTKTVTAPTPPQPSAPPRTKSARRGKRLLRGGIALILSLLLLMGGLLCGLGYAVFHFLIPHNTTASGPVQTAGASAVANSFVAELQRHQYDQAYNALGGTVAGQTSRQTFILQAQNEDTCYGTISTSTRLDNETTVQGNTMRYVYSIVRSHLTKPYLLYLTLQPNNAGNWQITDYNSNVTSIKPLCH